MIVVRDALVADCDCSLADDVAERQPYSRGVPDPGRRVRALREHQGLRAGDKAAEEPAAVEGLQRPAP